jgi:sugar transferase EpsL
MENGSDRSTAVVSPAVRSRVKRTMDLVGAGAGLLLLGPVIGIVWLMVRVTLGRPVLFRQERPGLHGRSFTMVKFRTMSMARDESGRLLPDEQRLTRVGTWLRRTSLDELPELVNVLRGDMSLVGPRPLVKAYLPRYSPEQARRHDVKPGVTGLAQVNGRNALPWPDRLALDVDYVDRWSIGLDVRILIDTVRGLLRREGGTADGDRLASHFMGDGEGAGPVPGGYWDPEQDVA